MAVDETRDAAQDGTRTAATPAAHTGVGPAAETAAASGVRRYPVAPGVRLNVRSGPGTQYALVRVLPLGAGVPINCQCPGERVTGTYGTSNIWDNIANGQFVSDAYVRTGSDGYVAIRCA
ncbi:peptidase [Streptomyces sp. NPDC005805]|uniref:peptidase n=1 Tax=Streptomyces sp. NPDC005805 TaxID=3157068 RepID=UPI0033C43A4D